MKTLNRKRVLSIVLALALTLSLLPATVFAASDVTLTIIHVNDRHGRMGADAYISQLAKDTKGNVLILDAGDAIHGQITANLSEGAAMAQLMNEVGYSAMVTGNHEFNYGIDRLIKLSEMMNFPLLAANVKDTNGNKLFQSHEVFEMDGVTVGVFGLATPETVAASDPRLMAGLSFDDPVETAKTEVAQLQAAGCDIVIALTHLGVDNLSDTKDRSDNLAEAVPGIDVIIDGHSHTELPSGLTVGGTLIAQVGEYGNNIGVVEITVSGGKTTKTARLIPVDDKLTANESITAKIAELDKANEDVTSAVVGYTPYFLQGEKTAVRTGQSNLADLITDSMLHATGADIAFMTGGNIRASIDIGDITMGEVLTTLPYSNLLVTVELAGADVLKALEHGVDMYPEAVGHYIHVAGLRFTFDPNADTGNRVKAVTMADGSALSPDKIYTVATIDFIAVGGDDYDMLQNGTNATYYGGDAEALISYLATKPEIKAEAEERVRAVPENALHIVMPDATHGFLAESIRHAEDELQKLAAETGLVYELHKTSDAEEQSACVDEAIQANAGAVLLWPITGQPLREAAQRVKEEGIPLIIYDRLIEGFAPDSEVLGDNMKIARLAGAYFNDYFAADIASGETINILELAGDDSTVPKQRTQGFMQLAGDNVNTVERFDTGWQREIAREQMANWLKTASVAEIESVQAIYSHEDETILGAMDAIAAYDGEAKINIRLIIGLGGKRDLLMHMGYYKEVFGIDLVTYEFSPAMIRQAIQDGLQALCGKAIAAEHLIDTFEIDSGTIGTYLASQTYKTRYEAAMPKVDDLRENEWYSFAVASRAIEFYERINSVPFNPSTPCTVDFGADVLAQSLPYGDISRSGGEALTRGVLAAMLFEKLSNYGLAEINGETSFADAELIGGEYKAAVEYVYKTGLMIGIGAGRFDPKGVVTHAQITMVMYNVVEACLNAAGAKSFNTLADFTGAKIGALSGAAFADFIDPVISGVKYTYYTSQAEMVAALLGGKVDAITLDMPVAKYVAAQNAEFAVFPETVSPDSYGFALAKGSPLADKINNALQKLKDNGTIAELEKIWFSADQGAKKLPALDYKADFDGSAGLLRYGCADSIEPMSYIDADGNPVGFDLDVVRRIAYELNMTIEFTPMGFDKLFTALNYGEVDMVGGSMSLTEQRQKTYSCTDAYLGGGIVLVVPSSVENHIDRLFRMSVIDAITVELEEILPVLPLLSGTELTTWNTDGQILMVTWNRHPELYKDGETITLDDGEVWTFTDKEIAEWYRQNSAGVTDWELRFKQLIGLPPDAEYTHFTALWVDPGDLLRPAYIQDITVTVMSDSFAADADPEFIGWFDANAEYSYYVSAYPWTRLGYTYDWADNGTEYGLSEFIIMPDSVVTVDFTLTTNEFIDWLVAQSALKKAA